MFFLAATFVGWIGGDSVYRMVAARGKYPYFCRYLDSLMTVYDTGGLKEASMPKHTHAWSAHSFW